MGKNSQTMASFIVLISRRFIVLTLLSSVLLAFAIGQLARVLIENTFQKQLQQILGEFTHSSSAMDLPSPSQRDGKVPPKTQYTAKFFDTARSAINSRWIATDDGKDDCLASPSNDQEHQSCELSSSSPTCDEEEDADHLPKGQHLLMDIEHVDGEFLDSEKRLAKAMLDLVGECGLTLLSYHCHGLYPAGVSCAGVLLESHVSFHTWPAEGVITLDLFTCGDESLLPIVPIAEKLFSIPRSFGDVKPRSIWSHKLRGFADDERSGESEASDFFSFPIGVMTDYKKKISSDETEFQRVDVYEVLIPTRSQSLDDYEKSLSHDGSYQATHPELFRPDRIVFLDGVMQSRRSGDAAYHEALVHPAMFAHSNPKRVAIIGGGEGATLREVLKHKTVEKVVMIEIDQGMVDLSRKYLPEWSDCTMLPSSADNCFDDARTELYCEDAFAWFIDRYGGEEAREEPFDVIIMDALDPQIQIPFVEALYNGGPFLQSIPYALNTDGIFVGQVGEGPRIDDTAEEDSLNRNRFNFYRTLTKLGFEGIRDYEESHGGFFAPWQFIAAFKSIASEKAWLHSEALVDYKIRARLCTTKDGVSPLLYFDGATMKGYRYPSVSSQVVFCKSSLRSEVCNAVKHDFTPSQLGAPPTFCRQLSMNGRDDIFLVPRLSPTIELGCNFTEKLYSVFDPAGQRH